MWLEWQNLKATKEAARQCSKIREAKKAKRFRQKQNCVRTDEEKKKRMRRI